MCLLSWIVPRTFSSCSTNNYERYLTSRSPGCILDKPGSGGLVTPAVCGNGFLERGEQCDCGTVQVNVSCGFLRRRKCEPHPERLK